MKKIVESVFGVIVLAIALVGFPFIAPLLENPAPAMSIRSEIARIDTIKIKLSRINAALDTLAATRPASKPLPRHEIDLGETFITK